MRTEKRFSKTVPFLFGLLILCTFSASASAPNVTNINPSNNSIISGQTWINTTVIDPDGYQIDKVSFRVNNSSSTNLTGWKNLAGGNQQYYTQLNTSNLSDGVYNISLRAIASNNDVGYGLASNLTVNNIPEQDEDVFVENPSTNQTVNGTIWINASYSGPKTEYNGTFRWVNTSGNQSQWLQFNTTYNTSKLADGQYWLFFNMTDNEGTFLTENISGIEVKQSSEKRKTSPPSINVTSPLENTVYRGEVPVSAEVTDEDSIISRDYRLEGIYGNTSWRKLNDTLRPGKILSGTYNLSIKAVDSNSDDSDTYVRIQNITLGYRSSKLEEPCCRAMEGVIDDFSVATRSETEVPVVFRGDALKSGAVFNFSGPVDNQQILYRNKESLDTSRIQTGRYSFQTGDSGGMIDILPRSDVAGRIPPGANVDLRYWENGTEVPEPMYNVSTQQWYGEAIYLLNTTLDRYWISASNGEGWIRQKASLKAPGREINPSKPRINDLVSENMSVTGKILDQDGNAIENLTLKLERLIPGLNRKPYRTAPGFRTAETDSTGEFTFNNISTGLYRVKSADDSWVRKNLIEVNGNLSSHITVRNESVYTGNITMTSNTGTLKLDMRGPSEIYSVLARGLEGKYYGTGFRPSFKNSLTLPAGKYKVKTYLFRKSGSIDSRENSLKIKNGGETTIKPRFIDNTVIEGSISENGKSLTDKTVILRNSTRRLKYTTETDEKGNYSVKVRNNTLYEVKAKDSDGRWSSKKIKAGNRKELDFSFQKGLNLSGKVISPGIKKVFIRKDRFYSSQRIRNGENYLFRGLNQSTDYTVGLKDFSGNSYSRTVSTGSENEKMNLSFDRPAYNLTLNITGYLGKNLSVDLRLESTGENISSFSDTGYFRMENLSSARYKLSVNPQNTSYATKNLVLGLDSNKEVDIDLKPRVRVEGILDQIKGSESVFFISSEGFWSFNTRRDGVFSGKIPPGNYRIGKRSENGMNTLIEDLKVPISGLEKNLSGRSNRYISGQINSNYSRLEDGYVVADRVSGDEMKYSDLKNGEFNVTGLSNYTYRVKAVSGGSKLMEKTLDLGEGSRELDLTASRPETNSLEVTVSDAQGNPLKDAQVIVSGRQGKTSSNGVVEFEDLGDGVKTVKTRKEGYNVSEKTINLTKREKSFFEGSDGEKSLDVVVERNKEYKPVKILLRDVNTPVEGASVVFEPEKSGIRTHSVITDSSGQAFIDDLEPGNYTVTVVKGRHLVKEIDFDGRDSLFDIGQSLRMEVNVR